MADMQAPSNRRFWAVYSHGQEPMRFAEILGCDSTIAGAYHTGKSHQLAMRVFHQQAPRHVPHVFNDRELQRAYRIGFAQELQDLEYVERS